MSARPDDVDRLFARLEPIEPPAGLAGAVMQAVAPRPAIRWAWAALDLVAIALLALLSISFGMELYASGALDLVVLFVADAEAAGGAFDDLGQALLAALPWMQMGGLLVLST